MKNLVDIVRTRDGTYYLRITCIDTDTGELVINTLLPFKRLHEAISTASLLQLHVDNVDTLALNQYKTG